MIYDRMEPLTPIRDPTVVNNGLSSMKPIIVNQHFVRTLLRVKQKVPTRTFGDKSEPRVRVQNSNDDSCQEYASSSTY